MQRGFFVATAKSDGYSGDGGWGRGGGACDVAVEASFDFDPLQTSASGSRKERRDADSAIAKVLEI